jgi:hypothetical protein
MGEKRNVYRLEKPEGRRTPGRQRRRWMDNIKMDFLETRLGGVDWIDLAQDRYSWKSFVNAAINLRVP